MRMHLSAPRLPSSVRRTSSVLAATAALLALACPILVSTSVGQEEPPTPEESLDRARLLMGQQDWDGAMNTLQEVTERQPDNAAAWRLLGVAARHAEAFDIALEASRRALEFEETAPAAMYGIGLIHAARGEVDAAFEWLDRAKTTGRVDMTGLDLDPTVEALRDDPRYGDLFPSPAEYADPFVEDAEILHEWRGEAAGDQFGWIARNAGDVDSDGIADVTTSAPTHDGDDAGRVYLYSGRTGALLWTRTGTEGDQLGIGIEAAGDVDADGTPDVIAGAPGAGSGGMAYVFSGRDGSTLHAFSGEAEGDSLGRRVSDVGDVDGDGHDDVLVGAPRNDAGGEDAGRAYLYSGGSGEPLATFTGDGAGDRLGSALDGWAADGRTILVIGAANAGEGDRGRVYVHSDPTGNPAYVIDSDDGGAALGGMFVSVVGDVDDDGTPDVYASDWSHTAKGPRTGRIYVHSGADGERLLALTGEAAGDGFGIGPADAGDVDGDGHDDLVVGAWQNGSAAPSGGKVDLHSGRDGSLLRSWTGKVQGETFGFDATGMGDVDGDGTVDLLLTSAWSAVDGARTGRVFILSSGTPRGAR